MHFHLCSVGRLGLCEVAGICETICEDKYCGGIGGKVDSTLAVGAELGVVGWVQEGSEEQHCFHATVLL